MSSSVKQRETGRISLKWIWRIIFFFRCCFLLLCSPDCVCTQQLCSSSQLRENDPLLALSHGGFIEYKGYKKKTKLKSNLKTRGVCFRAKKEEQKKAKRFTLSHLLSVNHGFQLGGGRMMNCWEQDVFTAHWTTWVTAYREWYRLYHVFISNYSFI